jgi:hypothetical protein
VIYDPKRKDNEEESAALFQIFAQEAGLVRLWLNFVFFVLSIFVVLKRANRTKKLKKMCINTLCAQKATKSQRERIRIWRFSWISIWLFWENPFQVQSHFAALNKEAKRTLHSLIYSHTV